MPNKTCPFCFRDPVLLPNNVCGSCCERLRQNEVRSREQVEAEMRRHHERHLPNATQEVFERNVARALKSDLEDWARMTPNGLQAATLATTVVDEAAHLPTTMVWHRRRMAFVKELISALPGSLFAPATRPQLNEYTQKALDYWNGKLTEDDRKKLYDDLSKIIEKKTPPGTWDEKSLPLWMLQKREFFDWMWEQFMDCVYECVPADCGFSDDDWIVLYRKHFPDVLEQWAQGR